MALAGSQEVGSLASRVAGPVRSPGQEGFDAEHTGFDRALPQKPVLVVGATRPEDMLAAVRFARDHGLPVGVQATGHGLMVPADGALLINTSRANAVHIDATRRTAWLQAGVTSSQVILAAAPHGLAPLCGAAPDVGAVSFSLGGGIGPVGRRFGFGADHVRRIGIVTADGEMREVSPAQHPDLFWAGRGAGTNFGVVTDLEIDLMRVAELYGGGLFFPGHAAAPVLSAFLECTAGAPDDLSLSVAFITFPDLPELPAALRGQFRVHLRVAYTGTRADAEGLIAPLRRVGEPVLDTLRVMPFTDIASIHGDPTTPRPIHSRSLVLRPIDERTLDVVLRHTGPAAPFMLELRHLGGALARQPAVASAVGHRSGAMNLFTSAYPTPAGFGVADARQEQLLGDLAPWSDGGSLVTFLSSQQAAAADVRGAYDAHDWPRLVALKTVWDPLNRFRFNANIPPSRQ